MGPWSRLCDSAPSRWPPTPGLPARVLTPAAEPATAAATAVCARPATATPAISTAAAAAASAAAAAAAAASAPHPADAPVMQRSVWEPASAT